MNARTFGAALAIAATVASAPAAARMYQWVNPESGRTQFSGHPPAWYRSEGGGPRVFVFDNGRLIDDTAVMVSVEHRALLRQDAFAGTPAVETPKRRARAAVEEESGAAEPAGEVAAAEPEQSLPDAEQPEVAAEPEDVTEATIDRLKSIITAWDHARTEQAKTVLKTEEDLKDLLDATGPVPGETPPQP